MEIALLNCMACILTLNKYILLLSETFTNLIYEGAVPGNYEGEDIFVTPLRGSPL